MRSGTRSASPCVDRGEVWWCSWSGCGDLVLWVAGVQPGIDGAGHAGADGLAVQPRDGQHLLGGGGQQQLVGIEHLFAADAAQLEGYAGRAADLLNQAVANALEYQVVPG